MLVIDADMLLSLELSAQKNRVRESVKLLQTNCATAGDDMCFAVLFDNVFRGVRNKAVSTY